MISNHKQHPFESLQLRKRLKQDFETVINDVQDHILSQNMDGVETFVDRYMAVDEYMTSNHLFSSHLIVAQTFDIIESIVNLKTKKQKIDPMMLKVIRILSRNNQVGREFCKLGVVPFIHDLLQHSHSDIIVLECAAILANTVCFANVRKSIIESGCIDLILEYMKNHQQESVNVEICAAISNMALFEDSCTIIVNLGGIPILMLLLKDPASKEDLRVQVLNVITNLSKQIKDKVSNHTFARDIYEIMKCGMSNHDLVLGSVHALGSMAFSRFEFGKVLGTELTASICTVMKQFPLSCNLQFSSAFCLAHLTYGHWLDRDAFIKNHGLRLILAAMKRFPNDRNLQTTGCFAIGALASEPTLRDHICTTDSISMILKSMSHRYPQRSAAVSEGGVKILSSFHIEAAASSAESLQDSLDNLLERPPEPKKKQVNKDLLLQMFSSVALLNLSENEECKESMLKHGVLHHLYEATMKVNNEHELRFVLANVFMRFTDIISPLAYMKIDSRGRVPTLSSLSRKAFAEASEINSLSWKRMIFKRLRSTNSRYQSAIPPAPEFTCAHCHNTIHVQEEMIRMYHLTLLKERKLDFCSESCMHEFKHDDETIDRLDRSVLKVDIDRWE